MIEKGKVKQSYGVAICRQMNGNAQVLLCRRRTTYEYGEFVLGKYDVNDLDKIKLLINCMTTSEKLDLLSWNFAQIWYRLMLEYPETENNTIVNKLREFDKQNPILSNSCYRSITQQQSQPIMNNKIQPIMNNKIQPVTQQQSHMDQLNKVPVKWSVIVGTNNYSNYSNNNSNNKSNNNNKWKHWKTRKHEKCTNLTRSYYICKKKYQSVMHLLKHIIEQSTDGQLLWEIPKGRAEKGESNLDAAIRETQEEVGIAVKSYSILFNINPYVYNECIFCRILYEIFTAEILEEYENHYFNTKHNREVDFVKWWSLDELHNLHNGMLGNNNSQYTNKVTIPIVKRYKKYKKTVRNN